MPRLVLVAALIASTGCSSAGVETLVGHRIGDVPPDHDLEVQDLSGPVLGQDAGGVVHAATYRPQAWTIVAACSSDGSVTGSLRLGVIPTEGVDGSIEHRALHGRYQRFLEHCWGRGR